MFRQISAAEYIYIICVGNQISPLCGVNIVHILSFKKHLILIRISWLIPEHLCVFCAGRLSSNVRILASLFVILVVFVVTTVLVKVDVSDSRVEFFIGTLVSVAVVSGASNLFSGSVFGISGHFPMRISQALISGTVLSQVGNVVYSVFVIIVFKQNHFKNRPQNTKRVLAVVQTCAHCLRTCLLVNTLSTLLNGSNLFS